ncbi:MAG: hypothetical protein EVA87_03220 [Rhodospirillaceae bacterium]|nr:MAG: hypothetical protein EVA87_03220 [Rhodospirillaceae bacterium]
MANTAVREGRSVSDFAALHEILKAAHRNLSPGAWDYLIGRANTEISLRRNRQALDSLAFRPLVLRNVRDIDLTADGPAGVVRVLGRLETEMEIVMGLLGLDSLDKLREEILKSVTPVVPPGPFSAFPFLNLPVAGVLTE